MGGLCRQVLTFPCSEDTKKHVEQAVAQITTLTFTLVSVRQEMQRLTALLPEYPVVLAMCGVGNILGPPTYDGDW